MDQDAIEYILSTAKKMLEGSTSLDYIADDEQYLRSSLARGQGMRALGIAPGTPPDDYVRLLIDAYRPYDVHNIGSRVQVDDTIHECPRCSSRKARVSEGQLRSADEGSTLIRMCVGCGHVF